MDGVQVVTSDIAYVDRSEIREGKVDAVKEAIAALVAFVEMNEPQLVSYGFFLNEDETTMSVVAIHPDSASMEFHMEVADEGFRRFRELIDLKTIDVYGDVSEHVVEQLRAKAEMLGRGTVVVHRREAGFARLEGA